MATIEGLTKARMLEIEAASVVDGEIVGQDLHLTRHDGTVIDAGKVVPDSFGDASTTDKGVARLSTQAEVIAGTVPDEIVTPATLQGKAATLAEARAGTSTTKLLTPATAAGLQMTGTISPFWTVGDPSVTLSDTTVVSALIRNRSHNYRPGDTVVCENILGVWYVVSVVNAAYSPGYTNFFPLPITSGIVIRPWDVSLWGLKGPVLRDYDIGVPFWVTKNLSGVVTIQGFACLPVMAANTIFATLPVGFRPSSSRYFAATVGEVKTMLVIQANGDMYFPSAVTSTWFSMANVLFHDIAQEPAWINVPSYLNGFGALGGSWPVSYAKDSYGWVWTRGLVSIGATKTDATPMFSLPAGYASTKARHFTPIGDGNSYAGVNAGVSSMLFRTPPSPTGSFVALDGLLWPPTAIDSTIDTGPGDTAQSRLGADTWQNSWTNYDSVGTTYTQAKYTKRPDGLVVWQGLLLGGTLAIEAFKVRQGFRPLLRTAFERMSNNAHGRFTIDPFITPSLYNAPGGAGIPEVGSATWFSIDGVAYQASA